MKAQAILTSLHFIGAELVAAIDLYKEKIYHMVLKEMNDRTQYKSAASHCLLK